MGGGIIGLSAAMACLQRAPKARLVVLEKESGWAAHQTGHNSGVIHSGIYYRPGSLKARFCREGNRSMVGFCQTHNIPHEVCGKVIVATESSELPLLETLYQRGLENGIEVTQLSREQVQEIEPHVSCLAGIQVRSTGIADYRQVALKYAELVRERGGELRLQTQVEAVRSSSEDLVIETTNGVFATRFMVNCAGLYCDRIAQRSGTAPPARIVPFRGEYYELKPEKRHLVKHLIYPVPNPNFPFLGVHFTRMTDGSIHAGPNAVLSLKREGYRKTDFDLRDFVDAIAYPGLWRLASKHAATGLQEIVRSFSKTAFVRSLQQLIPAVQAMDLLPSAAGVRAQALKPDGQLVNDFLLVPGRRTLHVCNAPSPAATASLEIGRAIAAQLPNLP